MYIMMVYSIYVFIWGMRQQVYMVYIVQAFLPKYCGKIIKKNVSIRKRERDWERKREEEEGGGGEMMNDEFIASHNTQKRSLLLKHSRYSFRIQLDEAG